MDYKDYDYKIMTEAEVKEIGELWENGHDGALKAFGLECAVAAVGAYKRGCNVGFVKGFVGTTVIVCAVFGIGKLACVVKQKIDDGKSNEEVN